MKKVASQLLRCLIMVCGLFSLNACTTLGPDYQEPEIGWLHDWEPPTERLVTGRKAQDEVDLRFWWHLFQDPVLNQLIDSAKQDNHSLRIAGLRIFESRALLGIAGSNSGKDVYTALLVRMGLFIAVTLYAWLAVYLLEYLRERRSKKITTTLHATESSLC